MPKTREEIREKVVIIVCEQLNVVQDKVKDETRFVNDLGVDSLDMTELVMEFEDEFHVDISDEDAEKLDTVGSAIDFLLPLVKDGPSSASLRRYRSGLEPRSGPGGAGRMG